MTGAGLLGYWGAAVPPERLRAAAERAPWRGEPSWCREAPFGAIVATGTSTHASDGEVSVVLHGRLDNTAATLDVPADHRGPVDRGVTPFWPQFAANFRTPLVDTTVGVGWHEATDADARLA